MLSKSFIATAFFLALTSSVNADSGSGCIITPALGITGTPVADNVQHPTSGAPCGSIPISQNIDSSTPIQANGNGEFSPEIMSFAAGSSSSRHIATVQVDASGEGTNFVNAQMTVNGDAAPGAAGSQQLTVMLPTGTKCAGGSNKDRCLVSFTTDAGEGNCVVVTQAGGNAKRSGDVKPKSVHHPKKIAKKPPQAGDNAKRSEDVPPVEPKPFPLPMPLKKVAPPPPQARDNAKRSEDVPVEPKPSPPPMPLKKVAPPPPQAGDNAKRSEDVPVEPKPSPLPKPLKKVAPKPPQAGDNAKRSEDVPVEPQPSPLPKPVKKVAKKPLQARGDKL